jgi:hypothetical protein
VTGLAAPEEGGGWAGLYAGSRSRVVGNRWFAVAKAADLCRHHPGPLMGLGTEPEELLSQAIDSLMACRDAFRRIRKA